MMLRWSLVVVISSLTVSSAWVLPSVQNKQAASLHSRQVFTLASSAVEPDTKTLSPPFAAALTMATAKLNAYMPEEDKAGMRSLLCHFMEEYLTANQDGFRKGDPGCAPDRVLERFFNCIQYGLQYGTGPDKYTFDVTHKALRGDQAEPSPGVDFYEFGCAFFRHVMDLQASVIMGQDNLQKAMQQIEAGENVVLLANHQSEADPQVVSCCLEKAGFTKAGEDMIYVAGHKVTTDPLAIPFSMGRNLICIHSKKHIDADPSTKPVKQKQNMRAINGLLDGFKAGGSLVWVAPSGGRDRRDVATGKVPIAPFDSKTIDVFRLMGNKSKVKTHFYTLAMVSYELCPPPDFVEAGVGEARNVRFVPVGIFMGNELESVGGLESRHDFCDAAFAQCLADYEALQQAIELSSSSASS